MWHFRGQSMGTRKLGLWVLGNEAPVWASQAPETAAGAFPLSDPILTRSVCVCVWDFLWLMTANTAYTQAREPCGHALLLRHRCPWSAGKVCPVPAPC